MSTQGTPTKIYAVEDDYFIFKSDGIRETLPVGVFDLKFSPAGPYLNKQPDIILPEKIYSNDTVFIEHVMKSWDALESGVLGLGLIGEKGLGKSLTGNLIAKKTNLPVIRLTQAVGNANFMNYLKQLKQDFVLFIDEFEKIFPTFYDSDDKRANQEELLTYLDNGTLSDNKMMFIVTSNSEFKISDFLKNRPSRLRYFRTYEKMDDAIIREVIEDLLVNKDHLDDLLTNLPYDTINLDSLIKIIQEMNLHGTNYSTFKSFFNFRKKESLEFNVDLLHEDGVKEPIVIGYKHPLYEESRVGQSRKILNQIGQGVSIFLQEGNHITENPIEPVEMVGFYRDSTKPKDEYGAYPEVEVRLLVSPSEISLHSRYHKREYIM